MNRAAANFATVKKAASPALSPSFLVDVERAMFDLNRAFDPLQKECVLDFHISGARDGYVYLSFALPEGMTRVFVSLLQSLHGFFRFVDLKARVATIERKAVDPAEIRERQNLQAEFRSEVCRVFDEFRGQGLEVKEAVKRTNSALKAAGNPWATHAVVSDVLRGAGRFRRGGEAR